MAAAERQLLLNETMSKAVKASREDVWNNVTQFPTINLRDGQYAGAANQTIDDLKKKYAIEPNGDKKLGANDLVSLMEQPAVLQQLVAEAKRMGLVDAKTIKAAGIPLDERAQAGAPGSETDLLDNNGVVLSKKMDYMDQARVIGLLIQNLGGDDSQVRFLDQMDNQILGQVHSTGEELVLTKVDLLNALGAAGQDLWTRADEAEKYVQVAANVSMDMVFKQDEHGADAGFQLPSFVNRPEGQKYLDLVGTMRGDTSRTISQGGLTKTESVLLDSAATDFKVGHAQFDALTDAQDLMEIERLAIEVNNTPDRAQRLVLGEKADRIRRNAIVKILNQYNVNGYRTNEPGLSAVRDPNFKDGAEAIRADILEKRAAFVQKVRGMENLTLIEANKQSLTNVAEKVFTTADSAAVKAAVEKSSLEWTRGKTAALLKKYQKYPAGVAEELMYDEMYKKFRGDLAKAGGEQASVSDINNQVLRNFFESRVKLEQALLSDKTLLDKPEFHPEVLTLRLGLEMGVKGLQGENMILDYSLLPDKFPSPEQFKEEVKKAGQVQTKPGEQRGARLVQIDEATRTKMKEERKAVGLAEDASEQDYLAARAAVDEKGKVLGVTVAADQVLTKDQVDAAESRVKADATALNVPEGTDLADTVKKVKEARGTVDAEAAKYGVPEADRNAATAAELKSKLADAKVQNAQAAEFLGMDDPQTAAPDVVRAALAGAAVKYGAAPSANLEAVRAARRVVMADVTKYHDESPDPSAATAKAAKKAVIDEAVRLLLPNPESCTYADVLAARNRNLQSELSVIKANFAAASHVDLAKLDPAGLNATEKAQVAAVMLAMRNKYQGRLLKKNDTALEAEIAKNAAEKARYDALKRLV